METEIDYKRITRRAEIRLTCLLEQSYPVTSMVHFRELMMQIENDSFDVPETIKALSSGAEWAWKYGLMKASFATLFSNMEWMLRDVEKVLEDLKGVQQ